MDVRLHQGVIAAGAICLASLGCIQMPVCVPEMNVVPAVAPGCTAEEVYAFRVDVTDRQAVKEGSSAAQPIRAENFQDFELTPLPLSRAGTTGAQVELSCASGQARIGFWNYFTTLTTHSLAVRLYRPGYATIELKPGPAAPQLRWHEAPDLVAQEQALDDLLGVSLLDTAQPIAALQQRRLEPGSKSPGHREALRFAAREYERLAGAAAASETDGSELQARLLAKAQRLRALTE